MNRKMLIPIVLLIGLTGCSLPFAQTASPTPSNEQVQTQVSDLLTLMPPTDTAPAVPAATATSPQIVTATSAAPQPTETSLPPTETPQPTLTTAPTVAPTIAPTQAPTVIPPSTDPKAQLGTPTLEDTFNNDQNWAVGQDKFTSMEIKDNSLVLTGLTSQDGWRLSWPVIKDFYLEATIKVGNCSGSDHYGLIFRVPDKDQANQGYLASLNCDGQYALRKWDGKKMTQLIPWAANQALQTGSNQTNRLGIMAVGSQIALYANGVLLDQIQDSAYSEGSFGPFVGANTTQGLTITLSDLAYWENPKP